MVAWGEPFALKSDVKDENGKLQGKDEADEDVSLFFSDLMPLVAEVESTVQVEAFVRIAPYISILADAISAYPQFEILTASTSGRLPFPVYAKYVGALEVSVQRMKDKSELSFLKDLSMSKEEHVLEVDGTSQLVIQHIGSKAQPGRLTLTDHSLYFEPSSIVLHRDAIKYDLSAKIDHTVSTELSGPWGSRMFDKAISYRTSSPETHIVFEFPQLTGSSRRDYWIALMQEVIDTHKVIRKYNLEGVCKLEALARSVLGIVRLQATRECMQLVLTSPGALLAYNLAQNLLRGGDYVLETLASTLKEAPIEMSDENLELDASFIIQKSSTQILESLKIWKAGETHKFVFYRVRHGEPTLLEEAVKAARESSRFLHKAKKKEEEVKLDGIGKNIALMKVLLQPANAVLGHIRDLFAWKRPLHSMINFIFVSVLILRDWIRYIPPILITGAGAYIIWLRLSGKAMSHREVIVQNSSGGISMDQVISAQRAVSQIETFLQGANIVLLKVKAIIMSVKLKAAIFVPGALFAIATVLMMVPFKYVLFAVHVGLFAFSLRDKTKENKVVRRLRELWHSVPPLPVRMVDPKSDEKDDDN